MYAYLATGILVGGTMGWFSFARQKLFLAGMATLTAGYFALFKTVTGPMTAVAGVNSSPLSLFGSLPMEIQTAAIVGLFAAFGMRIATWIHVRFFKKDKIETPAQRRARIYADYGLRDPLA